MKRDVLIAVRPDWRKNQVVEVLHLVVYPTKPSFKDFTSLEEELRTDPEIKLEEEFVLITPTPSMYESLEEMIEEGYEALLQNME